MRRLRSVAVGLLVFAALQSPVLAVVPLESNEQSDCSNTLVWDYKEVKTVATYKASRACEESTKGRIRIKGFLERCEPQGSPCERVEGVRSCEGVHCRLRLEVPHAPTEIGRYKSSFSHAQDGRHAGSWNVDWYCYATPLDRDCL